MHVVSQMGTVCLRVNNSNGATAVDASRRCKPNMFCDEQQLQGVCRCHGHHVYVNVNSLGMCLSARDFVAGLVAYGDHCVSESEKVASLHPCYTHNAFMYLFMR